MLTIKPELHYFPLAEGVTAFSTTRHGGASKGSFGTLNINPHRGDDPQAVEANVQAVAEELRIPPRRIVRQHQVHETRCRLITEDLLSLPSEEVLTQLEGYDAMITKMEETCIGVFTADCVPILFYDRHHRAIGAAHAGWRGTLKRIARHTLQQMTDAFGTAAEDVQAIIGPCISEEYFEVGQEVYDAFSEADFPMASIARMHEKWHIDLPLCNQLQLIDMGVPPAQIFQSGICTYAHHNDYFSARRLKKDFGTLYTGIILRGE